VGLVLTLGYAFFLVLRPFLAGLAWASVLAIAVQPLFRRLRKRVAAGRAALLTTAAVAVAFIAPTSLLMIQLASECVNLADRLASVDPGRRLQIMHSAQELWRRMQEQVPVLRGVDLIGSLNTGVLQLTRGLASAVGEVAQNFLAFLGLAAIVLLALFFFLRDGPALVAWLRRLSPLDADITERLFEEIRALTESSVAATLLIAIVQGTLGGLATAILGLPAPLIWGVAFGFCSLIPVFGVTLVWIPAVLFLVATGHHGKALVMLLASVLIINQVDNVIRPILVSGRSRLSFAVSALSVLGGVAAFGMLGLVLGPVVVSVLTAMLEVYVSNKPDTTQS
jgi:predicted PurR-regulated permease PerM